MQGGEMLNLPSDAKIKMFLCDGSQSQQVALCISSLPHHCGMRLCFLIISSGMMECVWSCQDTVSLSGSNHLHYKLVQKFPFPITPFPPQQPYHSMHNRVPFFSEALLLRLPPCVSSGRVWVSTWHYLRPERTWRLLHLQSEKCEYARMDYIAVYI